MSAKRAESARERSTTAARGDRAKPQAAGGGAAAALRWLGMIGIVSIALLRCMIVFAPQVVFDTDPAFDQAALGGLGPAGSLTLDVLLLLACAAALMGEWLTERGINLWLCALAAIPAPIIIWHALRGVAGDAGDLWHGATWLSAAFAAVAAAHLARERSMRVLLCALLAAALAPILIRGAAQIFHEHSATVLYYLRHRDELLALRGIQPGSPAAAIYERRLLQREPTGWFTTTNIFAALAAFGLVLWSGLALAAYRARMESGWWFAMALFAAGAAAGLWFAGSKGAMLAAIAGMALLSAPLVIPALRERWTQLRGLGGPALLALAGAALLGVVIRGAILPESFAGEKSLLFRWHYLIGAARMIAEQPLAGVGPDGFQDAYVLHRVPRSPEEVSSAHSMFIDWTAALGVFGVAWVALVIALVWRSGRDDLMARGATAAERSESAVPTELVSQSHGRLPSVAGRGTRDVTTGATIIGFVTALAFVPALAVEWPTLDDPVNLMMRLLGAAGFVMAALLLTRVIASADERILGWSWLAALAALIVHGQIEMTFTQPGSAVWAMAALGAGVAGGAGAGAAAQSSLDKKRRGIAGVFVPLVIVALAGWLLVTGVVPAWRQEILMREAAAALAPIGRNPGNAALMLERRQVASNLLVAAYEKWPANVLPLEAGAAQLQLAAADPDGPQPYAMLADAVDLLERALRAHDRLSSIAQAVGLRAHLFRLTGDQEHIDTAIALARTLTERDPHAINSWRRLGDMLWLAERRAEAADAYGRALEADRNFELDEMKRLPEKDRELLEERSAEGKDQQVNEST